MVASTDSVTSSQYVPQVGPDKYGRLPHILAGLRGGVVRSWNFNGCWNTVLGVGSAAGVVRQFNLDPDPIARPRGIVG
jgi:hypothetical protein